MYDVKVAEVSFIGVRRMSSSRTPTGQGMVTSSLVMKFRTFQVRRHAVYILWIYILNTLRAEQFIFFILSALLICVSFLGILSVPFDIFFFGIFLHYLIWGLKKRMDPSSKWVLPTNAQR